VRLGACALSGVQAGGEASAVEDVVARFGRDDPIGDQPLLGSRKPCVNQLSVNAEDL